MEHISEFHTFDAHSGVLLSFMKDTGDLYDIGEVSNLAGLPTKIKYWGNKNLLPDSRDKLLMESNIVGQLIRKKGDILIGQGLQAYREVYQDGKKIIEPLPIRPEILEWIETSGYLDTYEDTAVINWYKHANVFAEFLMEKSGKVMTLTAHDCKYVRAAEKMNGKIPSYYVCADWNKKIDTKNPVVPISNYDKDKKQPKFILHVGDSMFHDGYYYHPAYWGGEEWISLANMIPVFHKANIQNGYSVRFHIKIPKDYFLDKVAYQTASGDETAQNECIKKAHDAKKKFMDSMNDFLAGAKNSGRALFTIDDFDPMTKMYHGIKIEPVNFDMKDESLLKLFEISDRANIAGQGLPATLAGIETQGKLSSGAEIRNYLMYYIISSLYRPRRILLKPFELMLKLNNWYDPQVKYTFEDVLITKLDENKSGIQPMNNESNQAQ